MIKLTPYLLFNDTCKQAMEFYQSCFGGEVNLQKISDSVIKDQMPPAIHQKVLNARLNAKLSTFQPRTGCDPTEHQFRAIRVPLSKR
jgi:uncharacterized glyoxalase superfamily protein PhnB